MPSYVILFISNTGSTPPIPIPYQIVYSQKCQILKRKKPIKVKYERWIMKLTVERWWKKNGVMMKETCMDEKIEKLGEGERRIGSLKGPQWVTQTE